MKPKIVEDCQNVSSGKTNGGELQLTMAKAKQGYKRSSSARPERHSNLPHRSNESHRGLEVCNYEGWHTNRSLEIGSASFDSLLLGSSVWSIERLIPENEDALTPIMQETSGSEWRRKSYQQSSKAKRYHLWEEALSSEALGETASSALPCASTAQDDKAGLRISATLAPPLWNIEDEGVATSCKRIKANPAKPTKHYHNSVWKSLKGAAPESAGDVTAGPGDTTLGSNPGALDVDGDARETSALSGQRDAPKKKASGWDFYDRYKRGSSSSFPDYGPSTSGAYSIITDRDRMVAGERRTSSVPGGPFRPHNTLQRNQSTSSSLPRPNQKKIFNLQDGEFVASGEHRAAKRQKLGSEQTLRTDSSSSVVDLSETYSRFNTAQSISSKGSTLKQLTGSRSEPATLFQIGEYRKVEATVSTYKSSKLPKAGLVRRTSSGEGRSARQVKATGEKGYIIPVEAVNKGELEELKFEPNRHQSTAKRSISQPKTLWSDLDIPRSPERTSTNLEASSYFADQVERIGAGTNIAQQILPNGNLTSPVLIATTAPEKSLSNPHVSSNAVEEVQFLEEDSVDLVKADGLSSVAEREPDFNITSRSSLTKDPVVPKSRSISTEGDIPGSSLVKAQRKLPRKQTRRVSDQGISFNIVYIRAGEAIFKVENGSEPWQFQYDYEKREFDVCGSGDSMTRKLPGLVLKPGKIVKIIYNDDSPKVVIRRSAEEHLRFSSTLLVQTQSTEDGARLVQCLKRLNETLKVDEMMIERLNKVFDNEIKSYDKARTRIKSQNLEEICLLEANEARRAIAPKPLAAVRIQSTSKQEQPVNIRRKHSVTVNEDTRIYQPRKQPLSKTTTTMSSRDCQTSSHASEAQLHDSEISSIKKPLKRVESVDDFRPTTRASARQENGDPQLRPRKSRSPSPPRWTKQNPKWQDEKHWKTSLIFPAEGKQRATVDARDIDRLDEGEFLNDNLIAFYLRFLEVQIQKSHPEISKRIYFQNTYFYNTLTKGKVRSNNINYDAVKRWTSKVDVFSYDYIIVPVCEKFHWYVAIICNAPKLLHPSGEEDEGLQEADDLAILGSVEKSSMALKDQHEISLSMGTPENRQEIPVDEHQQSPTRIESASPSVTAQVEQMSLEDGNDEWPEPDAQPQSQQWRSNSASAQDVKPVESLIEDLTGKKDFKKQIESVDIPPKSKKVKRKSLPPSRRYDPREPRIITLDSLGGAHSPTCSNLRAYLVCEAKERKDIDITPGPLGMTATGLPQQSNYCDCGVFILVYVQKFLEDPDAFVSSILQRDTAQIGHWPEMNAAKMRWKIRQLIFHLHDEQTLRENEQREAKSKARKVEKNETKYTASNAPPISSPLLSSTKKAVASASTHESDIRIPHKASSHHADFEDVQNGRHHTPEIKISPSAPSDVQRSNASPREHSTHRDRTKQNKSNHGANTAATDVNITQDVEIIENPLTDSGYRMEPPKRRLNYTESSPSRSSVRRRIDTANLDGPFEPTRFRNSIMEQPARMAGERTTKTNVFKEFAKTSTSPYQNTRRKTGGHVSNQQSPVKIEDLKDGEPEVCETPPRALERSESFEDILEIEDSDRTTSPLRRATKTSLPLVSSSPVTTIQSTPRTLRSSPRDAERFHTPSVSPRQMREGRRKSKN